MCNSFASIRWLSTKKVSTCFCQNNYHAQHCMYTLTADLLIFRSSSGGLKSKQSPYMFNFTERSAATAVHSKWLRSSESIFRAIEKQHTALLAGRERNALTKARTLGYNGVKDAIRFTWCALRPKKCLHVSLKIVFIWHLEVNGFSFHVSSISSLQSYNCGNLLARRMIAFRKSCKCQLIRIQNSQTKM